MKTTQRSILSAILLLTGLVVLAYVPLILLTHLEFSFATFALYVLFPCLAIYFVGVSLYVMVGKRAGRDR